MEQTEKPNPLDFLTPEEIFKIVTRRRWLIILPLLVALVVGSYLAITLPQKYQAETLIIVEGQTVPDDYVRSLVDESVGERLNTMSQQILSRTNLEKIIDEFKLFEGAERQGMFMEDKVASLRNDISISIAGDRRRGPTNAFTISFKGTEPQMVMDITNALARFFIEENLRDREAQAIGTSDFLENELQSMRRRLEEKEQAFKQFRTENMGTLPEQLDTNLRVLDRLQFQLTGRQEALREARARLVALQNQPLDEEVAAQMRGKPPVNINQLRAELARLQTRYTDKHPDIIKIKQQIKYLEENPPEPTAIDLDSNPFVREAKKEIENLQREITRIQNQMAMYQSRVETIPEREQELLTLRRDYNNLKDSYNELLKRKLESEIAVNLERRQKGEQFKIIDPASLPKRPVEPDMQKLFLGTIAAGIGFGCALIFVLEYFNKPFRNLRELQLTSGLPTLAMIPLVASAKHRVLKGIDVALTGVSIVATLAMLAFFSVLTFKGSESALAIISQIKAGFVN